MTTATTARRPALRTVAGRDDVADLLVLQAFHGMPHYRTTAGRDDLDGWDPLSTEGPHRSTWRLTGYRYAGSSAGRAVYVFRVAVNDSTRVEYVAAELDEHDGARVTLHAADYQPAEERTRGGAETKAAERLAELEADELAGPVDVAQDPTTGAYRRSDGRPAQACAACGNGYATADALAVHACEPVDLDDAPAAPPVPDVAQLRAGTVTGPAVALFGETPAAPPTARGRYTVERITPDGKLRTVTYVIGAREAGRLAAYCLHDNGAATRAEATAAGMALEAAPVGTWIDAHGYRFRLVAE